MLQRQPKNVVTSIIKMNVETKFTPETNCDPNIDWESKEKFGTYNGLPFVDSMSVPMITRIFQTVESSFSLVQINRNGSNGHQ
jgi:hypothetical protein